ncbi:hypothetical protein [Pseudomonas sp. 58 R 12]|nr:hypothetical protein [Pseudomonas sp. 58 R 12]
MLEQVGVAGLAVDETLAGAGEDGLLDQALFVEAITEATLCRLGVVAEPGQHVVRAEELAHVGEQRVGFDQVLVRAGRELAGGQAVGAFAVVEVEQAVLPGGQVESRQAQGIDLLLGEVRRQLRVEFHLGRVAGRMGVGTAADIGVATVHDPVIDAVLGLYVRGATGLDDGGVVLVGRHQLGGFAQGGLFVLHLTDERSQAGFDTVHVLARRIALGERSRFAVPTTRLALTFGGKDPVVLGVVSHQADVAQLIDAHGHGAAGGNATAAV